MEIILDCCDNNCCICGVYSKKGNLINLDIALSMSGQTYSICKKCSKQYTVYQFTRGLFKAHNYMWPPKKIKGN